MMRRRSSRRSRHRPSVRRPDSSLPCSGRSVNPLRLFDRGARRRAGADHGPLPQEPRTRFNGEAIRMPAGARRRAVSPGIPKAQEACAWPDPAPPISPGPPASSPASSMTARRLSVEAPAFATAASALRAGRRGRRRSRGKRAPEPGAPAVRVLARLSRNAPVPEARPHRVPQIPQLRIP